MKYLIYFFLKLIGIDKLDSEPCYLTHRYGKYENWGLTYQVRICEVCGKRKVYD